MRTRYVYDNGEGPRRVSLSPELSAEVDKLVKSGFTYGLVRRMARSPKCSGNFLYAAAAEAVLEADASIGVHDLYEKTGKLFGKDLPTARRCMNYAAFDYEKCRSVLTTAADITENAFKYMDAMAFVALIAEETVRTAAHNIKEDTTQV